MTNSNGHAHRLSPAVVLTGTAKDGKLGPPMGVVDIGTSDQAYICRVMLPGVQKTEGGVSCRVNQDGTVNISGVIAYPEVTENSSTEYQMIVQELNPPGKFTVDFSLPGPVDPRLVSANFRSDGILEVVVVKLQENIVA